MARENWMKVGDYLTLQRGTTYKGSLVGQPGPALLGLGSIEPGGGFRADGYKTFGGECPPNLMLAPGDIYVALKGATKDGSMVGSVARLPNSLASGRLTQDTAKLDFLERDSSVVNHLYWVLRTPQYRQYCAGRITGSASASFSREDFLSYPVPPVTGTSRLIVSLLEAIEENIDVNRRMNQTLEEIAQTLFKSWFVDFDPVRAKAAGRNRDSPQTLGGLFPDSLVDSGLGAIPKGWKHSTVGEHADNFDSRRVPVSRAVRAKRQGSYPYHGAAGVLDHVDNYLFDGIYLLVGEDGSVVQESGLSVTQYVWGKLWVNNHAHVLQGRGAVSTEQLYLHFQFASVAPYVTGAVQPKLSQGRMNMMPFLFAGDDVCRAFRELVQPLFAKLRSNADVGRSLVALRDTLLPKLISGEIGLSAA